MTNQLPEQILAERYRLVRLVGAGKTSTVYEAEDLTPEPVPLPRGSSPAIRGLAVRAQTERRADSAP